MLQDNPSSQAASVSIGYANAAQMPRRPGLLTALGIADFLVACLSVLVNVTAIVLCVMIYRLTLPAPAASPSILPRAPSTPVTPYHGDYLPANGLPRASRAAIVSAIVKSRSINHDRQQMLDRLLAECGKQIFPNSSTSELAAADSQRPATANKLGPPTPDVLRLSAGRVEIDNCRASFKPANGAPETVVTGNFVATGGKTQFCAVAIDQAVDAVQRNLGGGMNALQAGALAELYRPDGGGLLSTNPSNAKSPLRHQNARMPDDSARGTQARSVDCLDGGGGHWPPFAGRSGSRDGIAARDICRAGSHAQADTAESFNHRGIRH